MSVNTPQIVRRFVTVSVLTAITGLLLFTAAGTLAYMRGWLFLGISFALVLVNGTILLRVNPDVIAARSRIGAGTKTFDYVAMAATGLAVLALPVLAGLDAVRFGTPAFGVLGIAAGIALLLAGNLFIVWSMAVNRHLEQTVRIQEEHRVIDNGPYRLVRHPMYVGMILQYLGTPLVLGSSWAFAATAMFVIVVVLRTAAEDRTLAAELPGYADFAARTRFRLLPGVW